MSIATSWGEGVNELLVTDLRLSLDNIISLLQQSINHGDVVDSFMLLAGASQIVRDGIEDDPAGLRRASAYVARSKVNIGGDAVRGQCARRVSASQGEPKRSSAMARIAERSCLHRTAN
ncbi:MAG TPA: hypothetical protein VIJ40_08470 [Acidimicrobiales bacterium]